MKVPGVLVYLIPAPSFAFNEGFENLSHPSETISMSVKKSKF
jgi:hypothetical protein